MSLIHKITPINDKTNLENVQNSVHDFLKETLHGNILSDRIIRKTTLRANGGTGRMFTLITTEKDVRYVVCNGGLERLIGYHYLKNALLNSSIEQYGWRTANTKVIPLNLSKSGKFTVTIRKGKNHLENLLLIDSDNFITVSEYVGEVKPDFMDTLNGRHITETTGFSDMACSANLRMHEGHITIFDTEYGSFTYKGEPIIIDDLIGYEMTFDLKDFI